jgi:carbonic anhydrase
MLIMAQIDYYMMHWEPAICNITCMGSRVPIYERKTYERIFYSATVRNVGNFCIVVHFVVKHSEIIRYSKKFV